MYDSLKFSRASRSPNQHCHETCQNEWYKEPGSCRDRINSCFASQSCLEKSYCNFLLCVKHTTPLELRISISGHENVRWRLLFLKISANWDFVNIPGKCKKEEVLGWMMSKIIFMAFQRISVAGDHCLYLQPSARYGRHFPASKNLVMALWILHLLELPSQLARVSQTAFGMILWKPKSR